MNEIPHEKREALKRMLSVGASYRAIASSLKVSMPTIVRYARMWAFSPVCGCGKPSGHRGWCRVRLDYSPHRRSWLQARWRKRSDSKLTRTVDAATQAAKALRHDLGRFVWSTSGAASMAYATCRICGKSVRVFAGDSQWERFDQWKGFAGGAIQFRCKTVAERAAEKAANQEKRTWRKARKTISQIKKYLRQPSSLSAASTPPPTSCE